MNFNELEIYLTQVVEAFYTGGPQDVRGIPAKAWNARMQIVKAFQKLEKENKELKDEADKFHKVMKLLRRRNKKHTRCQPRSERRCTNCNARDDLDEMLREYKGQSEGGEISLIISE